MKRRRRLFSSVRLIRVEAMAYGGYVIPPLSVVVGNGRITQEFWKGTFRIGYYGRQDGLNCVRLVNADGEYVAYVDQRFIRDNFEIVKISDETDVFGDARPILQPLASAS
jgi:hypothetical protein